MNLIFSVFKEKDLVDFRKWYLNIWILEYLDGDSRTVGINYNNSFRF